MDNVRENILIAMKRIAMQIVDCGRLKTRKYLPRYVPTPVTMPEPARRPEGDSLFAREPDSVVFMTHANDLAHLSSASMHL